MLKGGGSRCRQSMGTHLPWNPAGDLEGWRCSPPGAPARVMQGGPLYLEEAKKVRGPTRHAPKTSLPAPSPTHVDPCW